MAAPYECIISMTDDETFLFNVSIGDADGNAPPWADQSYEYVLTGGCGGNVLRFTEGQGITADETNGLIAVSHPDPDYRLRRGTYRHGLRVTNTTNNVTTQLFDGTVEVSQGNF